ncbi:muramidase-2 [Kordia sp. SMS9]|uniref:LysM peptidoglycan-binding domain-containing protein n=1 Tax=Kordia sp. SMS9 TaxID=2282170 RepID=UPI000E10068F|nr:LysM peptidoglycan-binding domain-containing protein [Kordia sp. SMS9]AXG70246.1 muramidase-2 [Kordia sp. SMS9]
MKKLLGFFLILLMTSCGASAQQYTNHKVARGETVESIAKQYDISPDDIIRLNPEARRGVRKNSMLVIPSKSTKVVTDTNVTFTNHKVRRKETLYGIAKKYGVSQEDILKYNEKVAKEGLKKGDRIAIPQFKNKPKETTETVEETKEEETDTTEEASFEIYTVKAKETKWGIAHSYGLTIEELEDINPEIKDGLQIGQEIKLPIRSEKPAIVSTEQYVFYDVKPKQTMYTLTRKLSVTEEELILLNPALKDGLKAGMVLKLPVAKTEDSNLEVVDAVIMDTFNFLENADAENVSNIAIMLPFKLDEMEMDSIDQTKEKLKKDRLLGYATEFYTGSLMALDSIKKLGFSVNVKVIDNGGKKSTTRAAVTENDFTDMHAVIGPILDANVEIVAAELKSDGIPVISPLTSKKVDHRNVYQTIPDKKLLEQKMLAFMKKNGQDKNVIIIADKNKTKIKATLQSILPNNKVFNPEEGNYIKPTLILPHLKEDVENWVILETDDVSLIANVTSVLNSYATSEKREIVLLTTDKNSNYDNNDNIYNSHLANLNFHYPSIDKPSSLDNQFVKNYKAEYGISPGRIATRGFDITFDILVRLVYDQNLAKSVRTGTETSYVENKFNYRKKTFGGFFNEGIYIVKYDGLEIKEAK